LVTRRYRLDQIEDAFLRESVRTNQLLTIRLRGNELVALGEPEDYGLERQRACVAELRKLLPSALTQDQQQPQGDL